MLVVRSEELYSPYAAVVEYEEHQLREGYAAVGPRHVVLDVETEFVARVQCTCGLEKDNLNLLLCDGPMLDAASDDDELASSTGTLRSRTSIRPAPDYSGSRRRVHKARRRTSRPRYRLRRRAAIIRSHQMSSLRQHLTSPVIVILGLVVLRGVSTAQVSCHPNIFGGQDCTSPEGHSSSLGAHGSWRAEAGIYDQYCYHGECRCCFHRAPSPVVALLRGAPHEATARSVRVLTHGGRHGIRCPTRAVFTLTTAV